MSFSANFFYMTNKKSFYLLKSFFLCIILGKSLHQTFEWGVNKLLEQWKNRSICLICWSINLSNRIGTPTQRSLRCCKFPFYLWMFVIFFFCYCRSLMYTRYMCILLWNEQRMRHFCVYASLICETVRSGKFYDCHPLWLRYGCMRMCIKIWIYL